MALNIELWIRTYFPDEEVATAPALHTRKQLPALNRSHSGFWERAAYNYVSKCDPSISGKDGHRAAIRVAAILIIGFLLPKEQAFNIFKNWNIYCIPPWTPYDLIYKLEQAEEKLLSHPNPGYLRERLRFRRRSG